MKTYVKPMMESEAFVANEYVAACWYVSCNHRSTGAVIGGTLCEYGTQLYGGDYETFEELANYSSFDVHKGDSSHTYLFWTNGLLDSAKESESSFYHSSNTALGSFAGHHLVSYELKGNGTSSNAS